MSTLDTRCPQCGALLRGDAAWCTLCHADLRPPPPPEPEPVEPEPLVGGLDPLTVPIDVLLAQIAAESDLGSTALPPAPAEPGQGDDGGDNPLAGIDDTDVMFAVLRAQSQDPVLSKFNSRFDSKASRFVLIVGGVMGISFVLIGTTLLLGRIFG